VFAHPASVDTVPTSGKQEDHVSMGWTAVRKLRQVTANVRTCLAVEMEILCAAQGLDLRSHIAPPSAAMAAAHAAVRDRVPRMDADREVAGQIAAVDELLPDICAAAAAHCGGLR
jgi:histidine ammonia-lyase